LIAVDLGQSFLQFAQDPFDIPGHEVVPVFILPFFPGERNGFSDFSHLRFFFRKKSPKVTVTCYYK
jgi:hypothetical protein